jgi:4'-phosphopantetheinyl transferase
MINVFVTSFDTEVHDCTLKRHLSSLPAEMVKSIVRYKRWQDRQRALLAKLVLRAGLESFGFPAEAMYEVQYDEYGRPWVEGEVDFNISHSGQFVLCAFTRGQRVGVDIEAVRPVNVRDFSPAFSPAQLREMQNSSAPECAFFKSWTEKESASKADGRGLSIPFEEITIENDVAKIGAIEWHLTDLSIHPAYSCSVAAEMCSHVEITELYFMDT